jgi:HSP20 family protein
MERLRQEFDDLFDRVFRGAFAPMGREFEQERWWDFDVQENDKEIVVRAEMPGFDEKDLDVQLNNDVLSIRAEKRQEEEGGRRFSSFSRAVTLPPGVEAEKARASYRNGVLELHFPRPEPARGSRIPIGSQAAGAAGAAAPGNQAQAGKVGNGQTGATSAPGQKARSS